MSKQRNQNQNQNNPTTSATDASAAADASTTDQGTGTEQEGTAASENAASETEQANPVGTEVADVEQRTETGAVADTAAGDAAVVVEEPSSVPTEASTSNDETPAAQTYFGILPAQRTVSRLGKFGSEGEALAYARTNLPSIKHVKAETVYAEYASSGSEISIDQGEGQLPLILKLRNDEGKFSIDSE